MKETQGNFALKVKIGEYEVEINGTREEVLKTVEELPTVIASVNKAFENARPKKVATLTVKTEASKQETHNKNYPKISPIEDCEEAVIRILQTDWGKWRPRTIDEMKEALQANGHDHAGRPLTAALGGLVKKGKIRRWNTDAGFVYILAEKESLGARGEVR
jgi:hypothetical protein